MQFFKSIIGITLGLSFCLNVDAMKRPAPDQGVESVDVAGSQVTKKFKKAESDTSSSSNSVLVSLFPKYLRPILCNVLKQLSPKDIAAFACTCKKANKIVKHECQIQADSQLKLTDCLDNELLLNKFISDAKEFVKDEKTGNSLETGKFLPWFSTQVLIALSENSSLLFRSTMNNQEVIQAIIKKIINPLFLSNVTSSITVTSPEENFWLGVKKFFLHEDDKTNENNAENWQDVLQHFEKVCTSLQIALENSNIYYAAKFFYGSIKIISHKKEEARKIFRSLMVPDVASVNPWIYITNLYFMGMIFSNEIEKNETNKTILNYPNVRQIAFQAWIGTQLSLGCENYEAENYKDALAYFLSVANDAKAKHMCFKYWRCANYMLGEIFYLGHGVDRNYRKALKYYNRAASCFESGQIDESNFIKYWLKAKSRLGEFFYNGYGVDKNIQTARDHYNEVIEHPKAETLAYKELLDAHCMLGEMLLAQGKYQEALVHYNAIVVNNLRASKANINAWLTAQNRLGCIYSYGYGVAKNCNEAINHFAEIAALPENIFPPQRIWVKLNAHYMLEEIYNLLNNWKEVAENCISILDCDQADEKHLRAWIRAHSRLGDISSNGYGEKINYDLALDHYKQIVKHPKAQEELFEDWLYAHYNLAILYTYCSKNKHEKASEHFKIIDKLFLSKQTNLKLWLDVKFCLGAMYYFGCGVDKDLKKASGYFNDVVNNQQAEQANPKAYQYSNEYISKINSLNSLVII